MIELGILHAVKIDFDLRGGKGKAWRRDRKIRTGEIKSEISYIVALHELAHVVGPEQTSAHRRIVQEIAAWEWAIKTCRSRFRLTRRMRSKISRSLSSYVQAYFWRRNAWLPTRDNDPELWARMVKILELGKDEPKMKALPSSINL